MVVRAEATAPFLPARMTSPPPTRRTAAALASSASPLVDAVRFSRNFWFRAPHGWRNAYAWLPEARPSAVLVLLHGYGEHALRYQRVGEAWAAEGIGVYAMDHAGHGENPCNRGFWGMRDVHFTTLVEDAFAFAKHVSTELHAGMPFFLMGHSMGAIVAVLAAISAQKWAAFHGLLLSSPAIRLAGQGIVPRDSLYDPLWMRVACLLDKFSAGFWPNSGAPVEQCTLEPGFADRNRSDCKHFGGMICVGFGRRFVAASQMAASCLAELHCAILVMHGSADTVALPLGSTWIMERASTPPRRKTLHVYKGGLHEILNTDQRADVMRDVTTWIRSRL